MLLIIVNKYKYVIKTYWELKYRLHTYMYPYKLKLFMLFNFSTMKLFNVNVEDIIFMLARPRQIYLRQKILS